MMGLQKMVAEELARRAEAGAVFQPFCVIVHDGDPKAIADTATAVAALEQQHKDGGDRVAITRDIAESVCSALEGKHPRMFKKLGRLSILARVIVDSHTRHAPVPDVTEGRGTSSVAARTDDDVVERARDRIAKLRGGF
jgi:hypothetical protein